MSEYKDIKTIAKEVREELKRTFPKCKFSVSIERYSMGQSMSLALMAGPFAGIVGDRRREFENGQEVYKISINESGYSQLNHYHIDPFEGGYLSNGAILSKEAGEVLKTACKIANKENWDNSDPQTDHFDVNYYFHLNIGKYDKPFVNTAAQVENPVI